MPSGTVVLRYTPENRGGIVQESRDCGKGSLSQDGLCRQLGRRVCSALLRIFNKLCKMKPVFPMIGMISIVLGGNMPGHTGKLRGLHKLQKASQQMFPLADEYHEINLWKSRPMRVRVACVHDGERHRHILLSYNALCSGDGQRNERDSARASG